MLCICFSLGWCKLIFHLIEVSSQLGRYVLVIIVKYYNESITFQWVFLRIFLLSLDLQCKIWLCKTSWEAQFKGMLVKGHIFYEVWGVQVFYWAVSVCVCWLRYLAGMVPAGCCVCVCVCVCVSFRLLWGAQNARWCLLNSKSSPTLDWSSAVWTTCCLEWPASIQTGRILQHQSYLLLRFLTGPFSLSFKCSMSSEIPGEWRLPLEREKKLVQLRGTMQFCFHKDACCCPNP